MRISRLLIIIGAFFLYSSVYAGGITISPLKHELTIEDGQSRSETIRVTNTSTGAATLYTSVEDFVAGDDSGKPKFIKPEDEVSATYSLSHWISLENESITLAPGETREVRFSVKVPPKSEPGGHYGAIFFSLGSPDKTQVAVVQQIGVLLLVNVPGNVQVSGSFRELQIGQKSGELFSSGTSFASFPIAFETIFQNTGNTHIKPTGKIELVDDNGEILKGVGRQTLVSPAGAFLGEKMVDYIPINDELGNVLPKTERKYESLWEGFGYNERNPDGTTSVKFKDLTQYYADKAAEKVAYLQFWQSVQSRSVTRRITANLSLSYDGTDGVKKDFHDAKTFEVQYQEKYIGLNYMVIAIGILVVGGVLVYIFVIVPRSRERLRRDLLRQMRSENAPDGETN